MINFHSIFMSQKQEQKLNFNLEFRLHFILLWVTSKNQSNSKESSDENCLNWMKSNHIFNEVFVSFCVSFTQSKHSVCFAVHLTSFSIERMT